MQDTVMKILDQIQVTCNGKIRTIGLYSGDLAGISASEAVDVLVVSAFPESYYPSKNSLIGALFNAGISVEALAQDKEIDLRRFSWCWLSRPVSQTNAGFRRILCFEPPIFGNACEIVGDIFRSIMPIAAGKEKIRSIAMPIVAAGDQGGSPEKMLSALATAAAAWLQNGLPIEQIKVVIRQGTDSVSLEAIFAEVKRQIEGEKSDSFTPSGKNYQYDYFCSYSHKDKDLIDDFVAVLLQHRSSLRIFVDRYELKTGSSWQAHIFEAIDQARKIICMLSPDYLASKICKEEFNIAYCRHRESDTGVLIPVYLRQTDLPTYIRLCQYVDVSSNREQMLLLAKRLASEA